MIDSEDLFHFFIALLDIAVVLDPGKDNPRFFSNKNTSAAGKRDLLFRTGWKRAKPAFVDAFGNESADIRMHPARFAEKQPEIRRHNTMKGGLIRFAASS